MKRTCNNECGNSACCKIMINWHHKDETKDQEDFFRLRGSIFLDVEEYSYLGKEYLLRVDRCSCLELCDKGCNLQGKEKPAFCTEYPNFKDNLKILPAKCVFADEADVLIPNMENL